MLQFAVIWTYRRTFSSSCSFMTRLVWLQVHKSLLNVITMDSGILDPNLGKCAWKDENSCQKFRPLF
uniref:Uncharacterized protein n=1 Tax=Cucumis melo TaxID=3656 RepID=A0A9I9EAL2_CUCME